MDAVNRRTFLKQAVMTSALYLSGGSVLRAGSANPHNIILIVTDDQR
jgi:hypothetical protein